LTPLNPQPTTPPTHSPLENNAAVKRNKNPNSLLKMHKSSTLQTTMDFSVEIGIPEVVGILEDGAEVGVSLGVVEGDPEVVGEIQP